MNGIGNEIVIVAKKIINNEIHPIMGCRELCNLYFRVDAQYEVLFTTIRTIESETDELPMGKPRKFYNKKYLAQLDREINDYLKEVKPMLDEACEKLIKTFGCEN